MEKSLLPKVNPNTGRPVIEDLSRKGESQYITEIVQLLEKENPFLANFIGFFAKKTKDPVKVICCATMVYKMLESQAEANRLEEKLRT